MSLILNSIFIFPITFAHGHSNEPLPKEVKTFIENRDNCDHFRGEEAYDQDRKREIEVALIKYCRGTDIKLKNLRIKFTKDRRAIKALKKYETHIE